MTGQISHESFTMLGFEYFIISLILPPKAKGITLNFDMKFDM